MAIHQKSARPPKPPVGPRAQILKRAHRHWELGVKLAGAGDFPRAEAAFSRAVQGNPRDPLYLLNLARSQMKTGGIDKALRNAMAALTLAPDDLVAREIAAACLKEQNRHEERATLWQQIPADVPLSAEYYRNLGESLANAGQHEQAIGALYKALGCKIDDALLHFRLGLSFNELGFKQEDQRVAAHHADQPLEALVP